MRVIKEIRWQEAITIIKKCKLIHAKSLSLLMAYYIISILNALFDGVSMVLLVGLITGKTDLGNSTAILQQVKQGLSVLTLAPSFASIYVAIILLFLLRMFLSFSVVALEGYFNAVLRRIIQEKGFTQLVKGNWEFLRNIRVGQRLGAITEESTYVARYFTSIIKAGYGAISSLVLVIIAMSVSTEVTLLFIAVGVPAVLILKYLFSIQSKIAARLVIERQELYADITEILNGLFQVKVEGNEEYHTTKGLKNQKRLTKSEISFGYSQAAVSAFNLFLPAVLLVVFYLWSAWSGNQLRDTIYILAGVGTVGARALTQVNSTIASLGNLIGFAGSIPPIYDLVNIPVEPPKELITEKVSQIQLREVSYWYGQDTGIKSINLGVKTGSPLILLGPSPAAT